MATTRTKTKRKSVAKKSGRAATRNVKLKPVLPPDLPTLYVDNLSIIHTPSDFTLSFMQARPPLFTTQAELDSVMEVESRCVARLVISPLRMQAMIQIIVSNWQKYVAQNLPDENGNNNTKTSGDTPSG